MDNLVLLLAGSYIDATVGATLGLATLTAAAAGQVVSDVSGVLCGGTLERVLGRTIPVVELTAAQRKLPLARNVALMGAVGGVVVGCVAGAVVGLSWIGVYAEEEEVDTDGGKSKRVAAGEIVRDLLGENVLYVAPGVAWEGWEMVQQMGSSSSNSIVRDCYEQKLVQKERNFVYVPVLGKGGTCWGVVRLDADRGEESAEHHIPKAVAIVLDKLLAGAAE